MGVSKKLFGYVLLGFVGLCGAVNGENVDQREWHFSPYVWLPSMDVTSRVPGAPALDLDMDFGDLWDNFDVVAVSARGEYWWGEWGVIADGLYMDMKSSDGLGPMGNAELRMTDAIVDMLGAYRFNLTDDAAGPSARLMAGGRYHYLKQKVSDLPAAFSSTRGGSEDWLEFVLGAQVIAPLSNTWLATARSDVSGFGIGSGSEVTWSAMAGLGWRFKENWMAKLGYRYYYIDYSKGSGSNEFGVDGNMQGPWIGVAYGM